MHDTALEIGKGFFALYWQAGFSRILDVGAMNVTGSLRACAPREAQYTGVDIAAGRGVDIVIQSSWELPLPNEAFDLVVSTSCFEHDTAFWVTFLEMLRVLKTGGYVYINSPANGQYHSFPLDCWRFYPDAGLALEKWARHSKAPAVLIESFTAGRLRDQWNDCVMIFRKGESTARPERFLGDVLRPIYNVRRLGQAGLANVSPLTEDQMIINRLVQQARAAGVKI